jgi:hypothetical protein
MSTKEYYKQNILNALRGTELTIAELVDKTGASTKKLRNMLPDMIRAGEVARMPAKGGTHNLYALPAYAAEHAARRRRELDKYKSEAALRKQLKQKLAYVPKKVEDTGPVMKVKRVRVSANEVKTTIPPQTWYSILGE